MRSRSLPLPEDLRRSHPRAACEPRAGATVGVASGGFAFIIGTAAPEMMAAAIGGGIGQ
jgi:hypothetical protein